MILRLLLFLFVGLNFALEVASEPLQKRTIRNARNRQAVCNDGTPAVYYFREGSGQGAGNWVFFLAGGGFCYSVANCNDRKTQSPELMTSIGKPATVSGDGIFSESPTQNPDFYNANQVVIPYCSSDLWSGAREASVSTGGHEFRGRKIFRAVVADLQARPKGRNLASADRILLSGTSAGGIGVMIHLDWLAAKFPNVAVRGLNDAGWTPDPDSLPVLGSAVNGAMKYAIQLWNAQVDSNCGRANSGSKYRCYSAGVYSHLRTPLMVQMSQHDTVFLGALGVQFPLNVRERIIAELFAAAVRDSLDPVQAAFSPRTATHGLLHSSKFDELRVEGYSLRQVLGNWFFQRAGAVKVID